MTRLVNNSLYLVTFLLMLSGLCSCEDTGIDERGDELPLVVEGWIEEGEAPVVMVTRAIDFSNNVSSLDNLVEKWCRVSVFDGEEQHILSGKIDKRYTPPFIYTTSRLKGERGKTYRLLVETEEQSAEAVAAVGTAPKIERIVAEKVADSDSLYQLRLFLADTEPGKFYKIFARSKDNETRFYGTFLGTFSSEQYDSSEGWVITRGIHSTYEEEHFSHYYKTGDIVDVKVCGIERAMYDFWIVYESNVSLSNNLFFSFSENCPSTVDGALGYWAGYGVAASAIRIP